MKKYLISLEKDQQRRELFFRQENTSDFSVFQAFNTMNEDLESLNKRFDIAKFLQHYGRNVTKGEVGCTLSHLGVYQQILNDATIQDDEYSLVCEDDVLFTENFQEELNRLIAYGLFSDIVLVGQSKITSFNDLELEINYPTTLNLLKPKIKESAFSVVYPYKNYFAGTVAYLIKKSAVKKLLSQVENHLPYWLADDFILFGDQFGFDIKVVRPLMAIENPVLNSNLASVHGEVTHTKLQKLIKYPLKKLLAIKRNLGN